MSTKTPRVLSIDEFMSKAQERPVEMFPLPEWGGAVELRPLTLNERKQMDKRMRDHRGAVDSAKGTGYCLIYGMVNPQLTETQLEGLYNSNGAVIDRIAKRILVISGLAKDEEGALVPDDEYIEASVKD